MNHTMQQIRQDTIRRYGDAPTTPAQALAHVLAVYADQPDSLLVVQATDGVYGNGIRTGLTLGDLRALAARITG